MTTPVKYSAGGLEPGTAEEHKRALRILFEAFPEVKKDDLRMKVGTYLSVVNEEPAWAVMQAVRLLVQGKVPSHNGRWLPTSAELGKVVREQTQYHRDRQAANKRIAETRQALEMEPLTAEQIARREKQVEKAREIFGITKEKGLPAWCEPNDVFIEKLKEIEDDRVSDEAGGEDVEPWAGHASDR
jgi:hypothetical protein